MRFALLASLLVPSAVLAQTRNFTLFLGDRPGGHATVRVQGNVRDVDFEMSDRSVVTKLHEHIVVDDDGTAHELRITGQAGGPQPIDEKFVRRDQRGMYVSQSGVPEEYAVLARALAARPRAGAAASAGHRDSRSRRANQRSLLARSASASPRTRLAASIWSPSRSGSTTRWSCSPPATCS